MDQETTLGTLEACMSLGDRLGMAGVVLALIALAATYLWPDKKWIGWLSLGCALVLLLTWGWMEFQVEVSRLRFQHPIKGAIAVFIIGGCLALALWEMIGPPNISRELETPHEQKPLPETAIQPRENTPPKTAHALHGPKITKPDVGAVFIKGTSPGVVLTSLSEDIPVRDPMCVVNAWNISTKQNLPAFNQSETGFVKKGDGLLLATLDNPGMKPLIKTGDRVFGFVKIDCPDCITAKYYWLFVIYGGESWYSPIPKGTFINIMDINQRLIGVNWDVEEFMKRVPHGERLTPQLY